VISLGAATRLHARLAWTRLARGRLLWLCAALSLVPVVAAVVLRATGHGDELFDGVTALSLRVLAPLVPSLLASGCIAEEIEQRTYTFVFARPAPRAALVIGKYVAALLPSLALSAVAIAIVWLLATATPIARLVEAEVAVLLGAAAFTALAAAIGSVFTRHPFVVVALYLLVVEAGIGSSAVVLHLLSISYHLRNLAGLDVTRVVVVPAWGSAVAAAAIGGLCLVAATAAVRNAEYSG
jgi:ABC-type transport system involved in multi-copper enzyme maturation permease subunit